MESLIFICTYTLVIVLNLLIITGEVGEIDQAQELMLRVESLQAAKEEIVVSIYVYIIAINVCKCMHIHICVHRHIYIYIWIIYQSDSNIFFIYIFF
jgi:hypothetical protein